MLTFRLFSRIQSSQLKLSSQFHYLSPTLFCNSKDNSSSSSDEDEPKPRKNKEAINKLNLLLESMAKENNMIPSSSSGIGVQLAKPPVKPKKEKVETGEPIVVAAKKVAEELGGDVKQTQNELLNKLISRAEPSKNDEEEPKKSMNLRDIISGMKIDRSKESGVEEQEGRAQQVRRILAKRKMDTVREQPSTFRDIIREERAQKSHAGMLLDLFGGEPLGIFKETGKDEKPKVEVPELTTWQRLEKRELHLAITHPPKNVYEEMILWTEQGKLWHFPIDNEQGLEEEKKIDFTEHIFLDHHLDPWCPKKGPVRYFMELVCIGLSKNPHITVQMKLEHINWFRDYFENKKQILEETGSLPIDTESTVKDEKTIS